VGMVREIITSENAMTVMELVSINDISIEKYLENPTQIVADAPTTNLETPPSVPADPDIQVSENAPTLAVKGGKNDIVCNEVAGENEHLIQQGDNLFAISRRYGVTVDQLKRWNKLETDLIHPCQKLIVVMPQSEKDALKAKGNDPKMPPAVKIPKEYDVRDKPKPLVNSPKPVIKKLEKSQEKAVPKGFTGSVTSPEPVAKALYIKKDAGLYVVQKGDNIYSIAKRHNLTEDKLRCINGLKQDERVLVGQVLKIEDCSCATMSEKIIEKPVPSDTLVNVPKGYSEVAKPIGVKKYHIVREGENIYSIARTYGLTADKLIQLNQFGQHEAVLPNQKILIEE
jgi:membrane-bound lytic murein transglycosylase D